MQLLVVALLLFVQEGEDGLQVAGGVERGTIAGTVLQQEGGGTACPLSVSRGPVTSLVTG